MGLRSFHKIEVQHKYICIHLPPKHHNSSQLFTAITAIFTQQQQDQNQHHVFSRNYFQFPQEIYDQMEALQRESNTSMEVPSLLILQHTTLFQEL